MLVNRMHFRYRKTTNIPHIMVLVVVALVCGSGCHSQTKYEQPTRIEDPPAWAQGMVWYQVFPERFRNGNPENDPMGWDLVTVNWDRGFEDPALAEIESLWNRRLVNPRVFSPDPNRSGGAARNTIFSRRYGGDLIGVYEKLEDLAASGVTGIYLCPVFESRSLHKYDAWDHRHIDPTLGHPRVYKDLGPIVITLDQDEDPSDEATWEWTPSDLWFVEVFLPKAKSLGLRVVLDGVWNHVGLGHWAFRDIQLNGSNSEYADWFDVRFDEEGRLIGWRGWNRVNGNLPVFKQKNGDLANGPKEHVMAVTRRWMDPNGDGDPSDGIDGWRLDVANEVGRVFWKDWRNEVRRINPEALIIGEIWSDAGQYFDGTAFDGQMNYPAAYAISDWLSIGGPIRGDGRVVAERLTGVFDHDVDHDLVQFNLMTSHDTERLASLMLNDFERGYDQQSKKIADQERYNAGAPDEESLKRSLMAYAALVAMPGSVMIYNGDEYGMAGADDPDNRLPIPWGTISEEQLVFQKTVTWLMHLRTDPTIGAVLRKGMGSFRTDRSGRGLVIVRSFEDLVVEIQIGGEDDSSIPSCVHVPESARDWLIVRIMGGHEGRKAE